MADNPVKVDPKHSFHACRAGLSPRLRRTEVPRDRRTQDTRCGAHTGRGVSRERQIRRFLIVLLGSFGLVTWSACGQAPPAEPMEQNPAPAATSADPKEQFAGTWKLVRVERYGPDGDLLPPPEPPTFGSDGRVGFIMYDSTGHMGVVTQQAGRQPYAGERRTPEEALAAITSYGSYFGPYTVNEAEGYVTHHVKGSVNPGGVGADNQRFYEFSGNQLILQPPPADSGARTRIVWERVPDLAELTPEHRKFVGFWEIDRIEHRTVDGEALPVNQYTEGYIIYMPSGHMAVHLMRPDRPQYADTRPTPEEAEAALSTYGSYFGPFTIHGDEDYVVHHRIGHIRPSEMGTDAQRFYEFSGNQLILKPPVTTVDGQQVRSYIHWNRISADN